MGHTITTEAQCHTTTLPHYHTTTLLSMSTTTQTPTLPTTIPGKSQYLEVPHNTRRRLSSTSSLTSESSTFYGTPREHIQHEGMLEALDKIEDEMVKVEETDEDWEYKKRMDLAQ